MATEKDGPAFPSNYVSVDNGSQWVAQGMTLRDYFAAKAMEALIINDGFDAGEKWAADNASLAYAQADAMLIERVK